MKRPCWPIRAPCRVSEAYRDAMDGTMFVSPLAVGQCSVPSWRGPGALLVLPLLRLLLASPDSPRWMSLWWMSSGPPQALELLRARLPPMFQIHGFEMGETLTRLGVEDPPPCAASPHTHTPARVNAHVGTHPRSACGVSGTLPNIFKI